MENGKYVSEELALATESMTEGEFISALRAAPKELRDNLLELILPSYRKNYEVRIKKFGFKSNSIKNFEKLTENLNKAVIDYQKVLDSLTNQSFRELLESALAEEDGTFVADDAWRKIWEKK